jgi:hypothetical protein
VRIAIVSDKSGSQLELIPKLSPEGVFTIHEILRYAFSGFLALFLIAAFEPGARTFLKEFDSIAVAASIALGAALYTVSRHAFGPLIATACDRV